MRQPIHHAWRGLSVVLALLAAPAAVGAGAPSMEPLWQLELPATQQAQIRETAILPGPRVVATTPDAVLVVEQGRASTLFPLERSGAMGRSALLPAVFAQGGQEGEEFARIGVLLHQLHALAAFELLDLHGKVVAKLEDARHFHYRLAPDGRSFVGIDAGDTHTALTARAVTYHFFDATGRALEGKGVVSPHPQPSGDSAYAPDGSTFLINSREGGLAAYDPLTAQRQWVYPKAVKSYAAANGETGWVLVQDETHRDTALLLRRGEAQASFTLAEFAPKENIRNLAVSPNGHHAVITARSLALVFGLQDTKPSGQFGVSAGYAINAVAVSDSGVIAVGAQAPDGQSAEVWLLDARSRQPLTAPLKFTQRRGNAWTPLVQWDAGGRYLLVRTLERMALYEFPTATQPQK